MSDQDSNNTVDIKSTILWRIYVIMLLAILAGVVLMLQIGHIQIIQGDQWRAKVKEKYIESIVIEAPRGNIRSDNGSLLVSSLPYYDLYLDTRFAPKDTFMKYLDTLSYCMAEFVNKDFTPGAYHNMLLEAYKKGNRFYRLKKAVSYLELQTIKQFPLFNKGKNKSGLIERKINKRYYPFKKLAERTLGYRKEVDKTEKGKVVMKDGKPVRTIRMVGLEGAYNEYLAGEKTVKEMQRIGGNEYIPLHDISDIEPTAGKDIVTTIDIDFQDIAQTTLEQSLRTHDAESGCVVLMEVKTGAIKAIANLTRVKNSKTQAISYKEIYNHAIGLSMEPGSTFKLAGMMALFEDGYAKPTDTVELKKGKTTFYNETMEDASYHGLERTTLAKAFELSSNVGIAELMNKYYNQNKKAQHRLINRFKGMHLNMKVGQVGKSIEGEGEPYLKDPSKNDWSGVTVPFMSIGYEVKMTPLQLLTFYNAVGNNGKMMRPYLVKEIRSYGKLEERLLPEVIDRKIASAQTIQYAKEILVGVVAGKNGTARKINTPNYQIAGKTGTAIMNIKEHKEKGVAKKYRTSFVGFFPAENPVYSCIVVVTNPRLGSSGGTVAAPVARKIADKCYAQALDIHKAINKEATKYTGPLLPDLQIGHKGEIVTVLDYLEIPHKIESTTNWTVARVESDTLSLKTRNIQDNLVPNVQGMGLRDALFLLENKNLEVKVKGVGKVKSQMPKAGRRADEVQTVTLFLD